MSSRKTALRLETPDDPRTRSKEWGRVRWGSKKINRGYISCWPLCTTRTQSFRGPLRPHVESQPQDGRLAIDLPNPIGSGCCWHINFPVGPRCTWTQASQGSRVAKQGDVVAYSWCRGWWHTWNSPSELQRQVGWGRRAGCRIFQAVQTASARVLRWEEPCQRHSRNTRRPT